MNMLALALGCIWWDKEHSVKNDRDWKIGIWIAVGLIAMIFFSIALSSCTIAPKVTEPARPSSWAKQNIVGYDRNGIFVTADWIRVYHTLLKTYGEKLPITEQVPADDSKGITAFRSNLFHVDWPTNKRFADLIYMEKVSGP